MELWGACLADALSQLMAELVLPACTLAVQRRSTSRCCHTWVAHDGCLFKFRMLLLLGQHCNMVAFVGREWESAVDTPAKQGVRVARKPGPAAALITRARCLLYTQVIESGCRNWQSRRKVDPLCLCAAQSGPAAWGVAHRACGQQLQ